MKILKQVLIFSLFFMVVSSWASDKGEELSDEVERVLNHYGLSYPQTLVQVNSIDDLVALFPEIFKEPMGVHKGWYDSLWGGISAYTKTDRSEQLKEKFYPLLDSDSIISATEKCIKGIWTRTRLIEKKVPASQYWKYFKPITTIAFSKTQKFEPLIPPLEDYQKEQLPLTFNIKSDSQDKKGEKN
jgi:hypothetical protein